MARGKLVEATVRLYKNCSDLPIRRFDIVYKTRDLRYLCLEYDGYNEIEAPIEAEKRWEAIFDEWVKLCDDNTISYYYQLILEVTYLETRYLVSGEMLQQIFMRYPEAMDEETLDMYIVELRNWKYIFDKKNDYIDEIKKLLDQRRASENKLGLKKSELEDMRREYGDSEPQTLEAQAIILEHITGIKTDLDKDSVLKWIETGKLATTINEQKRKTNGK
jgi:hypothetical protein